jgi:hypothetical protein
MLCIGDLQTSIEAPAAIKWQELPLYGLPGRPDADRGVNVTRWIDFLKVGAFRLGRIDVGGDNDVVGAGTRVDYMIM